MSIETEIVNKFVEIANMLVKTAFDRQNNEIETVTGANDGQRVNIGLDTIIDTLMHNVGRFCERHLGDFLITWDSVKEAINNNSVGTDIIAFAIRQNGVDSNLFLSNVVENYKVYTDSWSSVYYRKIFAVKIQRELEPTISGQTPDDCIVITVTLKDISDCVRYSDIKDIREKISSKT